MRLLVLQGKVQPAASGKHPRKLVHADHPPPNQFNLTCSCPDIHIFINLTMDFIVFLLHEQFERRPLLNPHDFIKAPA